MIGEYFYPYLLILARLMESPACDLKDVIYIGRLSHASLAVNVVSLLVLLQDSAHCMLKDTM